MPDSHAPELLGEAVLPRGTPRDKLRAGTRKLRAVRALASAAKAKTITTKTVAAAAKTVTAAMPRKEAWGGSAAAPARVLPNRPHVDQVVPIVASA